MKLKRANLLLNIASFVTHTQALGPGLRSVVWVQGCPIHCRGCIAPAWIPTTAALQLTPEEIVERILVEKITGLTFSGGEPMAQAKGLAEVARLAREKREIDIICFTGYRFEDLSEPSLTSGIGQLLSQIDVLIDGPYMDSQKTVSGLRGSANQRIIHFTPRLKDYDLEKQPRQLEINIENGLINMTGIPGWQVLSSLSEIGLARVLEIRDSR